MPSSSRRWASWSGVSYLDDLVRVGEEWRISRRVVRREWETEQPASGAG